MRIEERLRGDVTVLSVVGDIAMSGSGAMLLADTVRSKVQEGHRRIVLDLAHVRYVDSAGLGELVQAYSAVRNRGGMMPLLNVTKRLADLLVLTKLLMVFDCFDSEAEALASFEMPGSAGVTTPRAAGPVDHRARTQSVALLTAGAALTRTVLSAPGSTEGRRASPSPADKNTARRTH